MGNWVITREVGTARKDGQGQLEDNKMRVSKLLYKSINVLVALAMMLVTVPAGGVVAEDLGGPALETIDSRGMAQRWM
jgi:hypothetical protein